MSARPARVIPASGQSQKVSGKGGGSSPTPQTQRMHSGSGALHGSYPKNAQKLRG